MQDFRLYRTLSRARRLSYRGKIFLAALIATALPLIALAAAVFHGAVGMMEAVVIAGVVLVGAAIALAALNQILRPVVAAAGALRGFRERRALPDLPRLFTDDAGMLMADIRTTAVELEDTRDTLARLDRITGLPNRDAFLREVAARLDTQPALTVSAMRLNGYDRLTERKGQLAADRIVLKLTAAAQKLGAGRSYLARISPTIFATVSAGVDDVQELMVRVDAALAGLGKEIDAAGNGLSLTAGLAFAPQDGTKGRLLLENAIAALEPRSADDRQAVRVFSPVIRTHVERQDAIDRELRHALENSEFVLHYQPVIDLTLGRVIGAEALIRWEHPTRGLLLPGSFMPAAEAGGLIDPMGRWILDRATAQLRDWKAAGRDDLKVAINISAHQFRERDIVKAICTAVRAKGLRPGQLELELTGTAAMEDRDRGLEILMRLREGGVSIAMDDFGMGSSSMFKLLDMPFDRLKICRQFVSGVDRNRKARSICAALIALAGNLDAEIVAEGVETAEEVALLREMGVRLFQGYFFAKPLPADRFFAMANDLALTGAIMGGFGPAASVPGRALAG